MRAERGGACRGRRGKAKHRVPVTCGLRMVREPSKIGSAVRRVGKGRKRRLVRSHPPVRGQRILDGETCQLVAKRDAVLLCVEHSGSQTLVEVVHSGARQALEEPQLGLLRHDRDRVEHQPRCGAEACGTGENRVTNRGRDLALPAASTSSTKKGLPAVLR